MAHALPSAVVPPPVIARARALPQEGTWARDQLAAWAAADGATSAAAVLAHPQGVVVATGQQPALGGGPLYTLLKAAQAVAWARALSEAGVPAAAVFWCASDDHDLGEAGHADLVRADGSSVRIAHALGGGAQALWRRSAEDGWPLLWRALVDHLGAAPGAAWLEACAPRPGERLGAWHCRLLQTCWPELWAVEAVRLRPLWRPALERTVQAWPVAALEAQRQRLRRDGWQDAFGPLPEAPLWHDQAEARRRLPREEARALVAHAPLELSPGAALRPILQQVALPVAVYLGGPAEVSYHQVLTPLYAALQAPAPQLVERWHAALLLPGVAEGFAAWGVDPTQLTATTPAPRLEPGADAGAAIARLDEAVAAWTALAATHPELTGRLRPLERARRILVQGVVRSLARAHHLPPFACLRATLFPRGQPQERVLSVSQALYQGGASLPGRLVAAAAQAVGTHPVLLPST